MTEREARRGAKLLTRADTGGTVSIIPREDGTAYLRVDCWERVRGRVRAAYYIADSLADAGELADTLAGKNRRVQITTG